MLRKHNYRSENLLDYLYHQKCYKLIVIDLSRKMKTNIPQQINFIEKLEENDGVTMFFSCQKRAKNYFKLFFRFMKHNGIV